MDIIIVNVTKYITLESARIMLLNMPYEKFLREYNSEIFNTGYQQCADGF